MTIRTKTYIAIGVTIWLILVCFSAIWNISQFQQNQKQVYLESARSIFALIVSTREWNARHGGVYVPITDQIQPNTYLDVPNRDVKTTGGQALTLINPAFMTRLISEIHNQGNQVKFHITSLKPIRPENAAESWEVVALESFENGTQQEFFTYQSLVEIENFRYMAPLITQPSCLVCHEKQGYHVGDVRGGISITIPVKYYTPWALILTHGLLALLGCYLIVRYGTKLGNNIKVLEDQSFLDGLTLIYNRRFFDESLKKELMVSKRNKFPLSLLICDIDNFKFYNDTYGHPAGDECLKKVAQTLANTLKRPGDLAARFGGEEFGIILPFTDQAGANVVAESLRSKIEALQIPHKASLVNKFVTISIGVATVIGEDIDMITFIDRADQALYKAKLNGKNGSATYSSIIEATK